MSLTDAANIAQLISALAVVVSLIFVGLEVRQNSRALRRATHQAQADQATQYLIQLGTDPTFANLVDRLTPPNLPDAHDKLRATLIMNGVFAQFQAGWEAMESEPGVLKPWWQYQEQMLAGWLRSPAVLLWWEQDRAMFADGFRALVDAKIAALSRSA